MLKLPYLQSVDPNLQSLGDDAVSLDPAALSLLLPALLSAPGQDPLSDGLAIPLCLPSFSPDPGNYLM